VLGLLRPGRKTLLRWKHLHRGRDGLFEWQLHGLWRGESALLCHRRRLLRARRYVFGYDLYNHRHRMPARLRHRGRRLCFGNRSRLLQPLRSGQDREQDMHVRRERVEVSGLRLPRGRRLFLLQAVNPSLGLRGHDTANRWSELHCGRLLILRRRYRQGFHRCHRSREGGFLRVHEQPLELRTH
jgi:hypothetical protein